MIRHLFLCAAFWAGMTTAVAAETEGAVAQVRAEGSRISQNWLGRTMLRLELTQGVPFRVFTLDEPERLVLDFRDLDWSGLRPEDLLEDGSGVKAVRFGAFQPGWTRLVADLSRPLLPDSIEMAVDNETGNALLSIALVSADPEVFAARSGAPSDALWPVTPPLERQPPVSDDRFVVVVDPGHGGIDPGAEREGLFEKDLMLTLAHEFRKALYRAGAGEVVLTRASDGFVSLDARVAIAHRSAADVFISLHADALSEGGAQGATVYTLSDTASDAADAQLAARHNRADLIAGIDLTGSDDGVTGVLLDLARQETEPRSVALAQALVAQMQDAGGPMNSRPLRKAGFSVLKSADIPSVLVEIGFLSSARDLDNIRDPLWRQEIADAMAQAVLKWHAQDTARRSHYRQ